MTALARAHEMTPTRYGIGDAENASKAASKARGDVGRVVADGMDWSESKADVASKMSPSVERGTKRARLAGKVGMRVMP